MLLLRVFVISIVSFLAIPSAFGQRASMKDCRIQMNDGVIRNLRIDEVILFSRNMIDPESSDVNISEIDWIEIDSSKYYVRPIKYLKEDTIQVLEKVISGTLTLYKSPSKSDRDDLFVEKNGTTYPIRTYTKVVDQNYNHEIKEYISILRSLTFDCKKMSEINDDLPLQMKVMKKVITAYNEQCGVSGGPSVGNHKAEKRGSWRIGPMIGYNLAEGEFNFGAPAYTGSIKLNRPFFGVFVKYLPSEFTRISISNELLYEHITGKGSASSSLPATIVFEYDIEEIRDQLGLDIFLLKLGSVKLDARFGMSLQFQISNNTTGGDVSFNDNFDFSPFGGVSLTYGRLDFTFQLTAMAIHMKDYETQHLENRFSVGYALFNR